MNVSMRVVDAIRAAIDTCQDAEMIVTMDEQLRHFMGYDDEDFEPQVPEFRSLEDNLAWSR